MKPACYATLVAFYGEKPAELVACIEALQQCMARGCAEFVPYALEQVHATVLGLEGERDAGALLNRNFRVLRAELRPMQLGEALTAVRESEWLPMGLQLGGFEADVGAPFLSRGEHPYRRALSLQGESVVMIAWPEVDGSYPGSLAKLRQELATYGLLHKYHGQLTAADDDLFFVLGTVPVALGVAEREELAAQGREMLRRMRVKLTLGASELSVVQYVDPALPRDSSVARGLLQLTAADVDAEALARDAW